MNLKTQQFPTSRVVELLILAIAIVFFAYDLVLDAFFRGEAGSLHFAIEFVVFLGIAVCLVIGVRNLRWLRTRLGQEERRSMWLSRAVAENIDKQMEEWRLTRGEKDIAWLVLKGYRFSEIARFRGVKESTPRLQATSIYAKAGVKGRAELVAEILQPLLVSIPDGVAADKPAASGSKPA